jgi:type II secretory pathway pseudopilin PulG
MKQAKDGTRGFGLLEVMVSATLIIIGITAVASTLDQISRIYQHQKLITTAVHLAEGTLEELLGRSASDPELSPTPGSYPIVPVQYDMEGHLVAAGGFFRVTWLVVDRTPIPETRTVVVTVRWIEEAVHDKSFQLRGVRQ